MGHVSIDVEVQRNTDGDTPSRGGVILIFSRYIGEADLFGFRFLNFNRPLLADFFLKRQFLGVLRFLGILFWGHF